MKISQRTAQLLNTWIGGQAILPLVYFIVMTIWFTWPLVGHLRSAVVGWPGDNLYYVWVIGWFQKAIFSLHINPLFVPFQNYPYGWSLAYTEIALLNVLIALPFSLIGGPAFGYNISTILSFVLSGWFVYLWSYALFKNKMAAIIAGTIFAFAPYRLAHAMGHFNLISTQWLALYFFGLTMLLLKRTWEWKYVITAGIGLGLAGLSSMYYLYMGLVISLVMILGFTFFIYRRTVFESLFWKKMAAIGVLALPFIAAGLGPFLQLAYQGHGNQHTLAEVDVWSASITDFFLPSPTHFLWGNWITTHINRPLWVEQYIYLGAVPLFLMLAAVIFWKRQPYQEKRLLLCIGFIMLCSAILALGTTFHWFGKLVVVSYPEFLKRGSLLSEGFIPMPNYILFKLLPFYSSMRGWARYGVFVILFGSILASSGFIRIIAKTGRRGLQAALLAGVILLTGVDYRINIPLAATQPRALDLWLRTAPAPGSVVQFPISASTQADYILGSLTHQKPLLGMSYGGYFPKEFSTILPILSTFPSEESIRVLHERKVGYVVVDSRQYKDWSNAQVAIPAPELTFQAKIDQFWIYRLNER